jgi:hypothetical protein
MAAAAAAAHHSVRYTVRGSAPAKRTRCVQLAAASRCSSPLA